MLYPAVRLAEGYFWQSFAHLAILQSRARRKILGLPLLAEEEEMIHAAAASCSPLQA
jgi:hypothetical protein